MKLQKNFDSNNQEDAFFQAFDPGQLSLLSLGKKPVTATFTQEQISTDGGLLLIRELENEVGLLKDIASVLTDQRDPRYVDHSLVELLSQRVFQIIGGYEDGNDCNELRHDPVLKLCTNRCPEHSLALASQPTMSRFENSVSRTDLYRLAQVLIDHFIQSYDQAPPMIILDCDDTNHDTHGAQQLTLFNQHYKEYCYLPLHIYEGISGKLITTLLKPGRRSKATDIQALLSRIIAKLREHWEDTLIVVRGDSHFASRDLMDWTADQERVHFITGLTSNEVLKKEVKGYVKTARELFERKAKPIKFYHSFSYQANSWEHPERVVAKIEHNEKGSNVRFIVSDMRQFRARHLYEKGYCARGKMELKIKDHKTHLKSDRSSCHRFEANQLRLFLHSVAYVLIHTLKTQVLKGTNLAKATMKTIQLKLFKVAVKVKSYKTRIKLEFPAASPAKNNLITVFEIFRQLRT